MSVYDPNAQGDCFSKFTHSHPFSYYREISEISFKQPDSRTTHEKKLLADLLNNIQSVSQTFKIARDYKTYLLQCTDCIEACTFKRGEPLIMRGDKCNEILVILEGTVNIYELKSPQDIQKQMEEAQNRLGKLKFGSLQSPNSSSNKIPSQNSLGLLTRRRGPLNTDRGNPSLDLSGEQERVPQGLNVPPATKGFGSQRRLKIKSVVAFLRSKADSLNDLGEDRIIHELDYLPESEQLLLEDDGCRDKFFKDGACLLGFKDCIGTSDVVNEKCLLADYRSPVTLVAEDEVQCLRLNKDVFRDVLKDEIKNIEDKKNFFLDFFQEANHGAILQILGCIVEKKFKMHEKIYKQDDKSRGIYFVKDGGDVKLYLSTTQQVSKENEDEIEVVQTDLFLPNQQRAHKKQTLAVSIIGQGDFFGEEDMVLEQYTRKYTAVSSSDHLILYYISQKFHGAISEICPEVFTILKERARDRNNWMENNMKASEAVKQRTRELFQITTTKTSNLLSPSGQILKNRPVLTKKSGSNSYSESKNNMRKLLVVRDQDVQHFEDGNIPNYFAVVKEQDNFESNKSNQSNVPLKAWVTPDRNSSRKSEPRNIEATTVIKSMDLPPSYKLFEQERNLHRRYTSKGHEEVSRSNRKTMTGLVKEQDLQSIQSRVLRQANVTPNTPKDNPIAAIASPMNFKNIPHFGVRSYVTPQNDVKSPEIAKSPKSVSSYHLLKSSLGPRPPRVNHQGKPLSNLQNSADITRFETVRSQQSLSGDMCGWAGKTFTSNESQMFKGTSSSYRPGGISVEQIKVDSMSHISSAVGTHRKGSRPNIAALKQLNQFNGNRIETEPNPFTQFESTVKGSASNIFKPMNKKLSMICHKPKTESMH